MALKTVGAAVACALMMSLAACGSDDGSSSSGGEGSVTIKHKFGTTKVPENPKRIVTLGYNDHEFLLAMGVEPIAIRDWVGVGPVTKVPWAKDEIAAMKNEAEGDPAHRPQARGGDQAQARPDHQRLRRHEEARVRHAVEVRAGGGAAQAVRGLRRAVGGAGADHRQGRGQGEGGREAGGRPGGPVRHGPRGAPRVRGQVRHRALRLPGRVRRLRQRGPAHAASSPSWASSRPRRWTSSPARSSTWSSATSSSG